MPYFWSENIISNVNGQLCHPYCVSCYIFFYQFLPSILWMSWWLYISIFRRLKFNILHHTIHTLLFLMTTFLSYYLENCISIALWTSTTTWCVYWMKSCAKPPSECVFPRMGPKTFKYLMYYFCSIHVGYYKRMMHLNKPLIVYFYNSCVYNIETYIKSYICQVHITCWYMLQ